MDILTLLADPKILIIIVLVAVLAFFIYYSWSKTSSSIGALEESQKLMHKQLAHGVITDEKLRHPLRIDNASNMSEETMDYDYNDAGKDKETESAESESAEDTEEAGETESEESENESHTDEPVSLPSPKFMRAVQNLHQQHQQQQHQPQQHYEQQQHYEPEYEEEYESSGRETIIPNQDIIDELRQLKNRDDFIIIDSPDQTYYGNEGMDEDMDEEEEEIIEFNEIDEASPGLILKNDDIPFSVMLKKRESMVQEKIQHDLSRIDQENQILDDRITPKPKPNPVPKLKPKPAPAPVAQKVKVKTQPRARTPIKASVPASMSTRIPYMPKTRIIPKIKNVGVKV
jgi:hypothetical protein